MSLGLLLFLSILCMVVITLLFLLAIKKGYAFQHTIDPTPPKSDENDKNKSWIILDWNISYHQKEISP